MREQLRTQLNVILDTRETARGLIVNLSDVLFDTASSNLRPGAREKLARVSGILVSHEGLRLAVEGHTDSVGYGRLQPGPLGTTRGIGARVSCRPEVHGRLGRLTGFGEGQPVASNDTASGRQQNRRVELVVSGDIIGRR